MAARKGDEKPCERADAVLAEIRVTPSQLRDSEAPNDAPFVDCSRSSTTQAFRTDSEKARTLLGNPKKSCDGALWLRPKLPGDVVFVELKSGNFQYADEQIKATLHAWKTTLDDEDCCPQKHALVVMSGGAPDKFAQQRIKRFRRSMQMTLHVIYGRKAKPKKKHAANSRRVLCSEVKKKCGIS